MVPNLISCKCTVLEKQYLIFQTLLDKSNGRVVSSLLTVFVLLMFSPVSLEKGLNLQTPIISAGSFGPSCDYTHNLQRLLPPARKISDFFNHFWLEKNTIKPKWETAYIYKKQNNLEDCFWSVIFPYRQIVPQFSRNLLDCVGHVNVLYFLKKGLQYVFLLEDKILVSNVTFENCTSN